jgi:hypothetical protein
MSGDLPWPSPAEFVVVGRRWKYAPPPHIIHEAVVDDLGRWLTLLTGETEAKVVHSRRPDAVLLKPWVDPAIVAVELRIEPDGPGSAMTVLAYGGEPQLSDDARRWVRYRLGTIFGAALREWVDEPHL